MATIYIDPTFPTNGTGTIEDPKNTWVGLTWTAGNSYLQKRGTSFTTIVGSGGRISPSVSGTRNARITLGSYGDGPNAVIVNYADTGINLSRRSYITVENLTIYNIGATASAIGGSGDTGAPSIGITIRHNRIYGGTVEGIYFLSISDAQPLQELLIEHNFIHDVGGHGILCAGNHHSTRVQYNTIKRVGFTTPKHGISSFPHRTTPTPVWTLVSGTIYSTPIGAQTYASTVTKIYGVRYTATNLNLSEASNPVLPSSGEFGFSGGLLYINIGGVPTSTITFSYTPLNVSFCYNIIDGVTDTDNNEGHGIQFDDLTNNSYMIGNYIANVEGSGIQVNMGRNNVIAGNIIVNARKSGINLGVNGAILNVAHNNTIIAGKDTRSTGNGIGLVANNMAKNNIIVNYVTGIQGSGTSTEDFNNVFGATTVRTGGIGTGANTTTVDPKLTSSYALQPSSSLINTGTLISSQLDFTNRFRNNPPSIGAYEFISERATAPTRGIR